MILSTKNSNVPQDSNKHILSLRCPDCKHQGTLNSFNGGADYHFYHNSLKAGLRFCPNPSCAAVLFVIFNDECEVINSYPPEKIDFDPTNIPEKIVSTFEEAITCFANECYIAAAIMIRKTLEELCFLQGVEGENLKKKIHELKSKVVLPVDLLTGLDDLRLLGNDAAHIESREYNKISMEEIEIGLEFTKEVLKAVYQYSDLLSRLRSLKKSKESSV